jgi:tRNA threonylcarbamoyladenosine biosynthesis protein TsaB
VNLVALETATETVGVAVRTEAGVEATLTVQGRRRHVEALTPALEHVLGQVGLAPGDIGAVAVDLGPGLFTGLRVGVAAAKGLAQALGIGVLGDTSLDVLTAAAAADGHRGLVLAVVDARRGEVFALLRDVGGGDRSAQSTVIAAGLFDPGALAGELARLEGAPVCAVGDGAQRYHDVLGAVPGVAVVAPGLAFPPSTTLLDLAEARLRAGESPGNPGSVVPLYMREADARVNFERAARP